MARDFLSVYLNDHLAGAQMALELLPRLKKLDDSAIWSEIEAEIIADRRELEALMHSVEAAPSTARRAAAWITEKAAHLKVHVDDSSDDGALRRLELIEALALGIDGKKALWNGLQRASVHASNLSGLDYPRLIARAETQRRMVEERRLQAAADALATPA